MYKIFGLIFALASVFSNIAFSTPQDPAPPSPDRPATAPQDPFKLSADLVLVDVLPVQKKTGRIVGNLQQGDFTVFEDSVKQTVSYFSKEKLPSRLFS